MDISNGVPSVDNKKYATDNRLFRDATVRDGIFKNFEDPVTAELSIVTFVHMSGDQKQNR